MKKLLVVMLMLAMAVVANASMVISVNGVNDPTDDITINTGQVVTLDIFGADNTVDNLTYYYLGIDAGSAGSGSIDISSATVLYAGDKAWIEVVDDGDIAGVLNVQNPFVGLMITDPNSNPPHPIAPNGKLFDGIKFTCTGAGDVTINLFDGNGGLMDSQVIHQTPEPMTMALLGLGGMYLRRRK